ncbi:sensor histidine kinase [Winogradskyella bathintestinalis]|uniref:sensor histidine kinase n=1 Tax=Winogradskyella bathintestinalis TaxID=3035208 RepID=UPI0025B3CA75|nr:histidine kinase [Winogradskyella bathintestinalis]
MQTRDKIVTSDAERYLLVYMIGVLVIVSTLIIVFFIVFQKRKNQLLRDKIKQQQKFDEELLKTQQEIQEETLKHVGRELHDNVGQMLVLATMQMKAAANIVKDEAKSKVDNAASALKESLEEVRALSKSLNSDVIFNLGFDATVKNEVARLNKTGLIASSLVISGEKINFENKKDEIILFRILQEFFSNTLKYAEAEHLKVTLDYKAQFLNIKVEDDGVGCDLNTAEKGSGLINMEKRAELLHAKFQLDSQPENGTILILQYPYRTV